MKKMVFIWVAVLGVSPLVLAKDVQGDKKTKNESSQVPETKQIEKEVADSYAALGEALDGLKETVAQSELSEEAKDKAAKVIYKFSRTVGSYDIKSARAKTRKASSVEEATRIAQGFKDQIEAMAKDVEAFDQVIAGGSNKVIEFESAQEIQVFLPKKAIEYLRGLFGF